MAEDTTDHKKGKPSSRPANTLTWSTWAEKYSLPPGTGPKCDDDVNKIFSRDVSLYGYSPRYDDLCLVICKQCKQIYKLQALYKHYERRHAQRLVLQQTMHSRKEYLGPGEVDISTKTLSPTSLTLPIYTRPTFADKTLPRSHPLKDLSLTVGKEIDIGKERGDGSFHITSQTVHIQQKTLDAGNNFEDIIRKRKIETASHSHLSDFKSSVLNKDSLSPSSSSTDHTHTKIKSKKHKNLKEDKIKESKLLINDNNLKDVLKQNNDLDKSLNSSSKEISKKQYVKISKKHEAVDGEDNIELSFSESTIKSCHFSSKPGDNFETKLENNLSNKIFISDTNYLNVVKFIQNDEILSNKSLKKRGPKPKKKSSNLVCSEDVLSPSIIVDKLDKDSSKSSEITNINKNKPNLSEIDSHAKSLVLVNGLKIKQYPALTTSTVTDPDWILQRRADLAAKDSKTLDHTRIQSPEKPKKQNKLNKEKGLTIDKIILKEHKKVDAKKSKQGEVSVIDENETPSKNISKNNMQPSTPIKMHISIDNSNCAKTVPIKDTQPKHIDSNQIKSTGKLDYLEKVDLENHLHNGVNSKLNLLSEDKERHNIKLKISKKIKDFAPDKKLKNSEKIELVSNIKNIHKNNSEKNHSSLDLKKESNLNVSKEPSIEKLNPSQANSRDKILKESSKEKQSSVTNIKSILGSSPIKSKIDSNAKLNSGFNKMLQENDRTRDLEHKNKIKKQRIIEPVIELNKPNLKTTLKIKPKEIIEHKIKHIEEAGKILEKHSIIKNDTSKKIDAHKGKSDNSISKIDSHIKRTDEFIRKPDLHVEKLENNNKRKIEEVLDSDNNRSIIKRKKGNNGIITDCDDQKSKILRERTSDSKIKEKDNKDEEIFEEDHLDWSLKNLGPAKFEAYEPIEDVLLVEKNTGVTSIYKTKKKLDLNIHCGVFSLKDNSPCLQSLDCKVHTSSEKRCVKYRSSSFLELLANFLIKNNETSSFQSLGKTLGPRNAKKIALVKTICAVGKKGTKLTTPFLNKVVEVPKEKSLDLTSITNATTIELDSVIHRDEVSVLSDGCRTQVKFRSDLSGGYGVLKSGIFNLKRGLRHYKRPEKLLFVNGAHKPTLI